MSTPLTPSMPPLDVLFLRFGVALFLGFLIGLEREREKEQIFAGMRTFALISLLGAALAFLGEQFTGPWLFTSGFLVVAAFALLTHLSTSQPGHIGITTEVAFMLAFVLGGLVYWNLLALAAAVTVAVVLLLTFKPNLQRFAANVGREDIWAGAEFALWWVVVLPILPNVTFGPLDVLNPREIWLNVVFVAALNLAAYILAQLFGRQHGLGMIGMLGGLTSSTTVTLDFSRRSQKPDQQPFANLFALAIAIASTGMFVRTMFITLVVNASLARALLMPLLAGCVVALAGVIILWWQSRSIHQQPDLQAPDQHRPRSPFALRPAVQFGLAFAIVLLSAKAAQIYLQDVGSYLSGLIGGIAWLDAVTLSMAHLAVGTIPESVAVRSVTLGAASNMVFNGAIATALGKHEVRLKILPLFLLAAGVSIAIAFIAV